jgi:uncharacterized repeat protein (TIGR03806 family)
MMSSLKVLIFTLVVFVCFSFYQQQNEPIAVKQSLSEYGLFEGKISELNPTEGLIPYVLNTPLFSDYAEKLRFVKIPEGSTIKYNENEVFDFPEGTIILKTFFYPIDFRKPEKGRKLIETRVLILESGKWNALEYVWNDEQTDAFLEVAGDQKEVSYVDFNGKKKKHLYSIPNLNQCKGCHNRNEKMSPIGPSARQLNGSIGNSQIKFAQNSFEKVDIGKIQIQNWIDKNFLVDYSSNWKQKKAVLWNDENSGSIDERARLYLDINCAHCHRPEAPASTSGLNLSIHNTDKVTLGINKSPVAAGRGSGDMLVDILPQNPEKSILVYRMQSLDPGQMMPELGRKTSHTEGVELIKQWIKTL